MNSILSFIWGLVSTMFEHHILCTHNSSRLLHSENFLLNLVQSAPRFRRWLWTPYGFPNNTALRILQPYNVCDLLWIWHKCLTQMPHVLLNLWLSCLLFKNSGKNHMYRKGISIRQAPVFRQIRALGKSPSEYSLSGWMNYNYSACCWFPTSSNILILPCQSSDKSGLKVTDCTTVKVPNTGAFTVCNGFACKQFHVNSCFTMELQVPWFYKKHET